jgi:hypothetical protein
MRLVNLSQENETGYTWDELDYGDVGLFSCDGLEFVGMKIRDLDEEDLLLDLEDFVVYSDVEEYEIIDVFDDATLTYDGEEE